MIPLKVIPGKGGLIAPLEEGREVPFNIMRVFYIYDIDTLAVRGFHANHILEEVIISLRGSCRMVLHDGQRERKR
ncbi:MAG: FdtA/QdtA family cupin domain-containing protein [Acidobacteriota bacterium]